MVWSYHFKFFKGCLRQFILGPFLNTLSFLASIKVGKNFKRLIFHIFLTHEIICCCFFFMHLTMVANYGKNNQ